MAKSKVLKIQYIYIFQKLSEESVVLDLIVDFLAVEPMAKELVFCCNFHGFPIVEKYLILEQNDLWLFWQQAG